MKKLNKNIIMIKKLWKKLQAVKKICCNTGMCNDCPCNDYGPECVAIVPADDCDAMLNLNPSEKRLRANVKRQYNKLSKQ